MLRLCQRFSPSNMVCLAMLKTMVGEDEIDRRLLESHEVCSLPVYSRLYFGMKLDCQKHNALATLPCSFNPTPSPGKNYSLKSHVLLPYPHLLAKDPAWNSLGKTMAAYFAEILFKTWWDTPLNVIYLTWAGKFLQSEALANVVPTLRCAAVNQ